MDNGVIYWEAKSSNALGQINQVALGSGMMLATTDYNPVTGRMHGIRTGSGLSMENLVSLEMKRDYIGNITNKIDNNASHTMIPTERYTYDNLNRLQSVVTHYANGVAADPVSLTYDHSGNIKSKSDVGFGADHYDNVYNSSNPCGINPHQAPHSLNSIEGYADFCYDANGNMTYDKNINGAERNLTYNGFGKPERIIREHAAQNSLAQMDFQYGVNQQRVTRQDYQNGNLIESTTYVDTRYEQVISNTGEITHKAYIGDFAMIKKVEPTPELPITPKETFYFHRDHQNSIVNISDDLGISKECLSQDVWGKRRLCNWEPDPNYLNFTSNITNRGYTSHEHLDAVGLIHMNARVYDPVIGRFMSADDVIPDASDMQAFNRYAYVRNNPATLLDPTGNSWLAALFEFIVVTVFVNQAMEVFLQHNPIGKSISSYIAAHSSSSLVRVVTILGSIYVSNLMTNFLTGGGLAGLKGGEKLTGASGENPGGGPVGAVEGQAEISNTVVSETQQITAEGLSKNANGNDVTTNRVGSGESGVRTTSESGIQSIAEHEGFRGSVYKDAAGHPTIGYGHKLTKVEIKNSAFVDGITEEQGMALLRQDLAVAETAVRNSVTVPLTQSQFDSLVSLTFNVGGGNLQKSTLLSQLNMGNYSGAADQFLNWNKITVNGQLTPSKGLTIRRTFERCLFLGGC